MFGKFDEQGDIIEDTYVCALTGQGIVPGDAIYRFPGTPYFVRIKAEEFRNFTDEVRLALATQLPSEGLPTEEQPRKKKGEG